MWLCPICRAPASFADARRPWPPGWSCQACGHTLTVRDGIPWLAPELAHAAEGYDPVFFETLVSIEETNFWFTNRANLIAFLIDKYFPDAKRFLEMGCGTGSVLQALREKLPRLDLAGSEMLARGLQFAEGRLGPDVLLMQMDACALPALEEFDVVGAFDVLEHIADEETAISRIHDAIRPGGGAIFAVPQHRWLWSPADDAAHHQRRYARGELEARLRNNGFRILYSSSFNALLLPVMLASRMAMRLQGRLGGKVEPLSELRAPRALNGAFSAVLKLELALTRAGLRWPIGGSRFVVAQRPAD